MTHIIIWCNNKHTKAKIHSYNRIQTISMWCVVYIWSKIDCCMKWYTTRIIFHSILVSLSFIRSVCMWCREQNGDLLVWMIKTINNVEFLENTISFGTLIPMFLLSFWSSCCFHFGFLFSIYLFFVVLFLSLILHCIFLWPKEGKCQIIWRICEQNHLLQFNVSIAFGWLSPAPLFPFAR